MRIPQDRVDRQQDRLHRVVDEVPARDGEKHGIGGGLDTAGVARLVMRATAT